jgi:hypothetical protein
VQRADKAVADHRDANAFHATRHASRYGGFLNYADALQLHIAYIHR